MGVPLLLREQITRGPGERRFPRPGPCLCGSGPVLPTRCRSVFLYHRWECLIGIISPIECISIYFLFYNVTNFPVILFPVNEKSVAQRGK